MKRWTRWHADGWTAIVLQNEAGDWSFKTWQGPEAGAMKPASGRADAQHRAEDIVRNSGHRCTARCSFWVPDVPEDLE